MNEKGKYSDQHVVILINYLRRHHVLVFNEFAKHVGKLTILVSTPMESDRQWEPQWDALDVRIQKNSTITLNAGAGYSEKNFVHLPWDTVWQLRSLKPDVIFSYEMGMRTALCCAYRMLNRKTPVVMIGNMSAGLEKRRGVFRRMTRRLIKSSVDYFTYNGPSCKRYLQGLGIDDSKLIFFPYCFDQEKIYKGEKKFSPQGVKKLLYCGAMSERKAILPFTKLLAEYCESHLEQSFEFIIAGDGPFRDEISKLIRPNLNISFLGNCDEEQLRDCYRDTDVCLFPTYGDEWGLVPMEAWASGLPVLGSKHAQSIETLCSHGVNGWIFDSKCEVESKNALSECLNTSADKLHEMSRHARGSVKQFSPKQSADCLLDALSRANKPKSTPTKHIETQISTHSTSISDATSKNQQSVKKDPPKKFATLSLDLDNKWAYLKARGDSSWESFPSYLNVVVPRILSVLDELDLTITFFIVGQDAVIKENHDALKMIVDHGHEIANHSFHHEPSLHLYTPGELDQEFELSESAIENVTGRRTIGFRGPGFSLSDQTLKTLVRRGYVYDCTIFPTYLAPLARAFYFMSGSFTRKQRKERKAMFGKFQDGFMPNDPYLWKSEQGQLLELPVTTFPGLKLPVHATYLHYLASFSSIAANTYFSTALSAYQLAGTAPSFLLHPLDFMGCDDEPELQFFPGMKVDSNTKLTRIRRFLKTYREKFQVVPMHQFASMSLNGELSQRSVSLARTGVT